MPEQQLSLDQRIAQHLVEEDWAQAKLMSAAYTPPPGGLPTSEARELELWDQTDPSFDEAKAWSEHLAAGTDLWVAKTDIAQRKFPNRRGMIEETRPRVKEQLAFAEKMAERSARARVTRQEEAERVSPSRAGTSTASTSYPTTLAAFPITPGPVPLPLPRAAPQLAAPALPQPNPTLPTQPMTGPGLPAASPETG